MLHVVLWMTSSEFQNHGIEGFQGKLTKGIFGCQCLCSREALIYDLFSGSSRGKEWLRHCTLGHQLLLGCAVCGWGVGELSDELLGQASHGKCQKALQTSGDLQSHIEVPKIHDNPFKGKQLRGSIAEAPSKDTEPGYEQPGLGPAHLRRSGNLSLGTLVTDRPAV